MNSKKIIKFLSICLIFAITFGLFAACNNSGDTPKETPAGDSGNVNPGGETENPAAEIKDNLPDDLDFKGETLNIVQRLVDISWPCCSEFIAETENGDIFNDTIYKRNRTVEERLNVKLNYMTEDVGALPAKVRASISAGDNVYDLIAGVAYNINGLAGEGLFMNFRSVPYIDFPKPWWNQQIVKGTTIGDKLYLLAGDANLSVLMNCMLIFTNMKLIAEYELADIYKVVIDGKWTLDYMIGYIKDINKDLNGDGVMDKNDLYGFVIPKNTLFIDPFMESSAVQVTKTGNDGKPYFDMTTEKMAVLADKFCGLVYNNPSSFVVPSLGTEVEVGMFKNNQTLFLPYAMQDAVYWKDMESDFGMIPYPKYDEAQEKYFSRVIPGHTLFSIPVNSVKTEMTGAVMEALSSESYKTTTPVYFDIVLKIKNARDETTSKLIDIIRDGAYIDFSTIYNEQIGSPWHALSNSTQNGTNTFASWYEKNEPKIKSGIDTLIQKIEDAAN